MATETVLNKFTINSVPNREVYKAMQEKGLIKQDDPIPAARGMEYEYGKYYLDSEDGKTYKCERIGEAAGGKIVLQYLPHELVGNYFTAA